MPIVASRSYSPSVVQPRGPGKTPRIRAAVPRRRRLRSAWQSRFPPSVRWVSARRAFAAAGCRPRRSRSCRWRRARSARSGQSRWANGPSAPVHPQSRIR
ncbi:hypothetical protein G6F58_013406 [Rhizopus delemar]|nr:hypothetical protein G6F58_013406 [Rhizopus delemar]